VENFPKNFQQVEKILQFNALSPAAQFFTAKIFLENSSEENGWRNFIRGIVYQQLITPHYLLVNSTKKWRELFFELISKNLSPLPNLCIKKKNSLYN
jgi:hypothetical protein